MARKAAATLDQPFEQCALVVVHMGGGITVAAVRDGKIVETEIRFASTTHLRRVIDRIVARVGRRIDESSPMVDARLPDGSRVNAIIPPLALDGAAISIRRFGSNPLKLEDLLNFKAFTPEMVMPSCACLVQKEIGAEEGHDVLGQQGFEEGALKITHCAGGVDHEQDFPGTAPRHQIGYAGVHAESLFQVGVHLHSTDRFGQKGHYLLHGILESDVVACIAFEYLLQGWFQFWKREPNKVKRPAGRQTLVPVGGNNSPITIHHVYQHFQDNKLISP